MQSTKLRAFLLLACAAAVGESVLAQELLGVSFTGQTFAVSTTTGQGRLVGPTGIAGCNSMARQDGELYSVSAVGPVSATVRHLVRIDPINGQATTLFPLTIDVRALAPGLASGQLFAVANGTPDQLVAIDVNTGQTATIGHMSFSGIQALTVRAGVYYAWELTAGLLTVDPVTGFAVDAFPAVGTSGENLQFLAVDETGRLLGGRDSLFEVDVATGLLTTIGTGGYSDLRGAELRFGRPSIFGVGCDTANGNPAILGNLGGPLLAGTPAGLFSPAHQPNAIGLVVVGLSDTVYQGIPLPLDLDPLLGTSGCSLLVSADVTSVVVANPVGTVSTTFPLPNVLGGVLFFQLATFENVPGGLTFSNGLKVEMPF